MRQELSHADMEAQAKREAAVNIRKIEEEAKRTADKMHERSSRMPCKDMPANSLLRTLYQSLIFPTTK